MEEVPQKKGLFSRLKHTLSNSPENLADIKAIISNAKEEEIITNETYILIENIIDFSNMEVRDVMIPRNDMDVLKVDDHLENIISCVNNIGHSRFPVIGNDKDEVLGILHTKELFKYFFNHENFNLNSLLREAIFVPEGKSLSSLIDEFRTKNFHLAIVVDEFGGVSGLITLEDILEEIIGDIEDEFDEEDEEVNILKNDSNSYKVNAVTKLEEFNDFFNTEFQDEEVDTIGGFIVSKFGHLPETKEKIVIDDLIFQVSKADYKRVYTFRVTRQNE